MGCDFTIHIGKPKIRKRTFLECDIDSEHSLKQPRIVVGECSFLKASLFNDPYTFVPYPIMKLSDLIPYACDGYVVITEDLIKKIESIEWINTTSYELYVTKEELIEFLRKHIGKPCYYICW